MLFRKSLPIQFASSKFCKENISFYWNITDAKSLYQAKARVQGPKISTEMLQFPVHLYLDFTKSEPFVEIAGKETLPFRSNYQEDVQTCGCSFAILSKPTNQPLYTTKCECKIQVTSDNLWKSTTFSGSSNLPDSNDSFNKYFYDRSLTLLFSCSIVNFNKFSFSCERIGNESSSSIRRFRNQFPLDYNQFSDVKIRVHEKIFEVHKVILSSVSDVFLQLFKNSKDIVDLSDVSSHVMSDLLAYIYSGNAPKFI